MTVRTRFAPSPTGYLHIGGVRTALFNWLFARQHGGQFILRIDDTDAQRNVTEALQPILDGFRWLGLDWDEGAEVGGPHGPYYQSQRLDRYQAAVKTLLDKGLAYWDYARPEETKAEMEAAEKEKRPKIYSRRWMAATDADRRRFEAEGRTGAVKVKMPREGVCRFADHVRGNVEVAWATEQDIVIQRSDGSVTYNLANVVDDFDMRITHVIRAEEHLANTPRQVFMLEGLGYPRPEYAHVPFVAEPGSKNKLSKRKIAQYLKNPDFKKVYDHAEAIADRIGVNAAPESFNPVLIDFYKQVGYLPDAIINYLVLLGWSLDDKTEEFTRGEMVKHFSLERVTRSAASFDAKKLFAFQERCVTAVPAAEKVERVLPFLERAGLGEPSGVSRRVAAEVVEAAGPRLKVFGDIVDYVDFFTPDDRLPYDAKAVERHLRKEPGSGWIGELRELVAAADPFDVPTLKARVEAFVLAKGAKPIPVTQTLRVAVTGKEVGFGVYETLTILGRDRCLARIDRALATG
ncbi:MAG: glutamate--tRNA ligase [Gemmataceae bacterium]|nr:glutamate--tRNA ligase [Gemmataceae bacterium]